MSDTREPREPRDKRGPDDERDTRDHRRPTDPRDARDARLPGDHRDREERALDRINRHPLLVGAVIASLIAGVGWFRLSQIVETIDDQQQEIEHDRSERITADVKICHERNMAWNRAMVWLDGRVDDPDEIEELRALGIVECPTETD